MNTIMNEESIEQCENHDVIIPMPEPTEPVTLLSEINSLKEKTENVYEEVEVQTLVRKEPTLIEKSEQGISELEVKSNVCTPVENEDAASSDDASVSSIIHNVALSEQCLPAAQEIDNECMNIAATVESEDTTATEIDKEQVCIQHGPITVTTVKGAVYDIQTVTEIPKIQLATNACDSEGLVEQYQVKPVELTAVSSYKADQSKEQKECITEDREIKSTRSLSATLEPTPKKSSKGLRRAFTMRFGGSKKTDKEEQAPKKKIRTSSSLDRDTHSLKTSMKNAFQTMKTGVKRTFTPHRTSGDAKVIPARPPRIGQRSTVSASLRKSCDELDQQSLKSVSGPSITDSPIAARRDRIQEAAPYLMEALAPSSSLNNVGNVDVSVEQKPLEMDIKIQPLTIVTPVPITDEELIEPLYINRGASSDPMNSPNKSHLINGLPPLPMSVHASRPPRPNSPPALSPIDYQPYHSHSDNQSVRSELSSTRVGHTHVYDNNQDAAHSHEVLTIRDGHNIPATITTNAMDRRQTGPYRYESCGPIRRAQTLRTDYATRMKNRVSSLRRAETGSMNEMEFNKLGKPIKRQEIYVCSDTIKFPKLSFKSKKNKQSTTKREPSVEIETMVKPRPKPYIVANVPPSFRSPPPVRITNGDRETVQISRITNVQNMQPTHFEHSFSSSQPSRQLTSLLSLSSHSQIQQSTFVSEYPGKGILYVTEVNGSSTDQPAIVASLPYISTEAYNNLRVTQLCTPESDNRICDLLRSTQSFMGAWHNTGDTIHLDVDDTKRKGLIKSCLQDYFNACIQLRSVDLQGHFSPFHHPLPTFDQQLWIKCAEFSDWENLQVFREPQWHTEYVRLIPSKITNFVHPELSIDAMLAYWFDCHHTTPQTNYHTKKQFTSPLYHPVSFVATLNRLLEMKPFDESDKNDLLHLALRIAVLLSYENCLDNSKLSRSNLNIHLDDILIVFSPGNCLVLFRPNVVETKRMSQYENGPGAVTREQDLGAFDTEHSTEVSADELVKVLCPSHTSIPDAIDALINELFESSTVKLDPINVLPNLMKAVVPPNWIAMMLARVYLRKEH